MGHLRTRYGGVPYGAENAEYHTVHVGRGELRSFPIDVANGDGAGRDSQEPTDEFFSIRATGLGILLLLNLR